MKLLNASGVELTPAMAGEANRLYSAALRHNRRPCKLVSALSTDAASDIFILIAQLGTTPAGDRILIVNGNDFRIISANGNTVCWSGGKPPFTIYVGEWLEPGTFVNVNETVYTVYVDNETPSSDGGVIHTPLRQFTVMTHDEYELIDTDQDWWAADDALANGEATQKNVGVIIQDSSTPPRELFAPFGGIEGIYTHFGPNTWCIPIIRWAFPEIMRYGDAIPEAHVFKPATEPTDPSPDLPGTLTQTPDAGTVLNAGTHQVSASFTAEDALHYHPAEVVKTIEIAKADQRITAVNYNQEQTLNAAGSISGTASSGLPVAFTSLDMDVLIQNGTVSISSPGIHVIYANQAGNGNYNSAPQAAVSIIVTNRLPDPNFTITRADTKVGTLVTCTDTTPPDPDNDVITVTWTLEGPDGSAAVISADTDEAGSIATFTPDVAGNYLILMTVTDAWEDGSKSKATTVSVDSNKPIAYNDTVSGKSGVMLYVLLAGLPVPGGGAFSFEVIEVPYGISVAYCFQIATEWYMQIEAYDGLTADLNIPFRAVQTLNGVSIYSDTATIFGHFTAAQQQTISFSLDKTSLAVNEKATVTITSAGAGSGSTAFTSSNTSVATIAWNASATRFEVTGHSQGSCTIKMHKDADATYGVAEYWVNVTVSSPLTVRILDDGHLWVSGGVPLTNSNYATERYTVTKTANATGGVTAWSNSPNDVYVNGTCFCPGSGITITDAAGTSVFTPFEMGVFGPRLYCSGCPSEDQGGWSVRFTNNTAVMNGKYGTVWNGTVNGASLAATPWLDTACNVVPDYTNVSVISTDGLWKIDGIVYLHDASFEGMATITDHVPEIGGASFYGLCNDLWFIGYHTVYKKV